MVVIRYVAYLLLCTGLLPNHSYAEVLTLTSRDDFNTAVGHAPDFSVDFDNFVQDTYFTGSPVDVGAFTVGIDGASPAGVNLVDVSPFQYDLSVDGTPDVYYYVEGAGLTGIIHFTVSALAFGADFYAAGDSGNPW